MSNGHEYQMYSIFILVFIVCAMQWFQYHFDSAYVSIRQLSTPVKILDLTLFRSEHSSHLISNSPFILVCIALLSAFRSSSQKCPCTIFLSRWVNRSGNWQPGKKNARKSEWKKNARLSTTYSSRSFLYRISGIQWIVWTKCWSIQPTPREE